MIVDWLRTIWRFRLGFIAVALVVFVPVSLAYEWEYSAGGAPITSAFQMAEQPTPQSVVTLASTPATLPPTTATIAPTPTVGPRYADIHPNELGKIMVLEYHVIGDEELRWTRTREHFRQDLEYLYQHGYYLIGLNDLLDNHVRVPAGKTPVVITFDDSNRSQFQFIKAADGSLTVDPTTGLGILDEFAAEHPDFGRTAVFCVLPGADPPNDLFGQPEYRKKKLQYLVQDGSEICNHTLWHAKLDSISDKEIVRQLALAVKAIQDAVPGYQVNTFNPPSGIYPDNINLILSGTFEGVSYHNRAILKVGGGPMTAPNDRKTNFLYTPRIQAIPSELNYWFKYFEQHPEERYVSDGDPDRVVFPVQLIKDFDPSPGAREESSPDPAYKVFRLR